MSNPNPKPAPPLPPPAVPVPAPPPPSGAPTEAEAEKIALRAPNLPPAQPQIPAEPQPPAQPQIPAQPQPPAQIPAPAQTPAPAVAPTAPANPAPPAPLPAVPAVPVVEAQAPSSQPAKTPRTQPQALPQPQSQPQPTPQAPPNFATGAGHPFAQTANLLTGVREQIGRVFLGQEEVVRQVLASLIAGGHVLLEGKPGLGKTHLVVAMAHTFGGKFGRIQFTPDLMPSDVTGHTLYDMGKQEFTVRKGPVFANLLLADEINRAPAKTQAALLEVMQEAQVTIDGKSYILDPPFMTIATQNPIEQEGTYPLPEAQLDRFLMKVLIDYPDAQHEHQIVANVASGASGRGLRPDEVEKVCGKEDVIRAQNDVAAVKAVGEVVSYALNIARATRTAQGVGLGAGTRGAIGLVRIAKAYAVMDGRDFITPHDVKQAVGPVLRHRVQLSPELVISGQTVDGVLGQITETVPPPRE